MNHKRFVIIVSTLLVVLLGVTIATAQEPVGTTFTYQGRLTDSGTPANGSYEFAFTLYDGADPNSSTQVGNTLVQTVEVNDGLFTVDLDFGSNVFTGEARYLDIGVRPAGSSDPFSPLSPRQALNAAPYALGLRPGAVISGQDIPLTLRNTANGIDLIVGGTANGGEADDGIISSEPSLPLSQLALYSNNDVSVHLDRDQNSGSSFVVFNSNDDDVFRVGESGTTRVHVLQITGGADLSERFDVQDQSGNLSPQPGLVVCIDAEQPGELVICGESYDHTVAGVISGAGGVQPGMVMGQADSEADGEFPVALTGRVYVQADASSGAIQPGDLLTTSAVPGHVMKVTDHEQAQGAILGKAMSALAEGQGLVLVLMSLQ